MDGTLTIIAFAAVALGAHFLTRAHYRTELHAEQVKRREVARDLIAARATITSLLDRAPDPTEIASVMAAHTEKVIEGLGHAMWPAAGPMVEPVLEDALDDEDEDVGDDARFSFIEPDAYDDPQPFVSPAMRALIDEPAEMDLNVDWEG